MLAEILPFGDLLQVHKQEASEGIMYVTIYNTIILGILGYLGAVKKISIPMRFIIVAGFTIFAVFNLQSLLASRDLHEYIHHEICLRLEEDGNLLKSPKLKARLTDQEFKEPLVINCDHDQERLPDKKLITATHVMFDLGLIGVILFIGKKNLWSLIRKRRQLG